MAFVLFATFAQCLHVKCLAKAVFTVFAIRANVGQTWNLIGEQMRLKLGKYGIYLFM